MVPFVKVTDSVTANERVALTALDLVPLTAGDAVTCRDFVSVFRLVFVSAGETVSVTKVTVDAI